MRKILVTGAAGFIGSNFIHHWLNNHELDKIVALDNLTYAGNKANIREQISQGSIDFIRGSICDLPLVKQLMTDHSIDTIVHFAAESHVDRSIASPDIFLQTNIIGTHSLLKVAQEIWLEELKIEDHIFHHVSTDEVYGSLKTDDPAFNESQQYSPNSPYAASKASSDHLVRAYHKTFGLKVTTSNCSNNYGPYQFPEKLIPLCILNILKGLPLPIYGDGKQVRDWLYVEDHCRGIEKIISKGKRGETYNIGGNNEWSNIDVVTLICQIMDLYFERNGQLHLSFPNCPCSKGMESESLITYVDDRPGHDRRYAIDASKIIKQLDFQPIENFESGIKKTVDWYLNNNTWWESILDGSYQE